MNRKAKRRLIVVGGIVVIAMLVVVAIAGAGGSAASLTVGDVLTGQYESKKVQVSGSVVADSLTSDGSTAIFEITPEDGDGTDVLQVAYDGALPATFGTGVVAICTGTVEDGTLACTEMVTKCPSKYESAEGSLTVKGLLDRPRRLRATRSRCADTLQVRSMRSMPITALCLSRRARRLPSPGMVAWTRPWWMVPPWW